ncbi:hypothetical protein, partial [Pseudorhodoplanes sp.]|uniref:hypothetical protein n=1 Tax=Pseudorhodoplanes sp. TaxID=1934341 RepID=UPI003D14C994
LKGCFIGFALLPAVLETPIEYWYPVEKGPMGRRDLSAQEVAKVFRGAWIPPQISADTLH